VEDDPQVRRVSVRLLREQGFAPEEAGSLAEAWNWLERAEFDLVLSDMRLPDGSGQDLTDRLARTAPGTATILMSGQASQEAAAGALAVGVDDYLIKPFTIERFAIAIARALRRRRERADQRPAAEPPPHELADEVFDHLARAGRFRDEETAEHVERVSRAAALIARQLGYPAEWCSALRAASAMHDIGKIGVPDRILRKAGKLTSEERLLVERHAEIGHQILAGSDNPVMERAAAVALTHHERPDGTGYPRQLAGDAIPIEGRITAVADVFDALTHDRVYRPAMDTEEALRIMREGAGTQFDAEVLAAFETVLPEIEEVRLRYPDAARRAAEEEAEVEAAEAPLKVLIIEDHVALARGLELLLRREGMEIAGTGASLADGERLIDRREADVAILDVDLGGESGLSLVPRARERGIKVLLFTGGHAPPPGSSDEAPDGTASKTSAPAELVKAVRGVAAGESPADKRVAPAAPSQPVLTPREREILTLLACGLNGEQIAGQLFLSWETVRTHIRNAREKLGATTRTHAAMLAFCSGEISPTRDSIARAARPG
jgi:putative two-component system response regulator